MVLSSSDPTETAIQKMIAAHWSVIKPGNNPAINHHQELQISTLEKAPHDAAKLESMIRRKELQKERANNAVDVQELLSEIDMLGVVLFLVKRDERW